MNTPKYQVFVSSTYEDLKKERDAVIQAVLEMGHIPVGMEMFSAADDEQWKIITRQIDQSDYYITIVAQRYGSIVEELGVSYSEREYDYAVAQKVPILGFVIDDKANWPGERFDRDSKTVRALETFKAKVKSRPVGFWSSAEELHAKAAIALGKAINTSPRPGWIRATEGTGPEVASELARLSKENEELRMRVAATDKPLTLEDFAWLNQRINLMVAVDGYPNRSFTLEISWLGFLKSISKVMLMGAQSNDVLRASPKYLTKIYPELFPDIFGQNTTYIVRSPDKYELHYDLLKLGIVPRKSQGMELSELTTRGEHLLILLERMGDTPVEETLLVDGIPYGPL